MGGKRIADMIRQPECLGRDTIPLLGRLVERYPYFQTARLLLLQNLYKEKDALFSKELSRSAALLADRSVLFDMIEGADYKIEPLESMPAPSAGTQEDTDRTQSLIENFLGEVSRKPSLSRPVPHETSPIDASVDYMGYMMQQEGSDGNGTKEDASFGISGKIVLEEKEEYDTPEEEELAEEEYFTETLAKIYIKQKKYGRALEIIQALSAANPKKNSYFADQIRFLEKLIGINKNNEEYV